MNDLIAKYAAHGFELEIDEARICAKCVRPSPRARLGYKIEFNYRYGSVARMIEHAADWIDRVVANKERSEQEKAERKARAAEKSASIKVGDIFVDSWGYEQTNIDFYQVVAKPSAKTVIVREIACERVEGSEMSHGMADRVRPARDQFIGEEMKKRINAYGGFKTYSFSSASLCDADRDFYRSWYA